MEVGEMGRIADAISEVLSAPADPEVQRRVRRRVTDLCHEFPLDLAE